MTAQHGRWSNGIRRNGNTSVYSCGRIVCLRGYHWVFYCGKLDNVRQALPAAFIYSCGILIDQSGVEPQFQESTIGWDKDICPHGVLNLTVKGSLASPNPYMFEDTRRPNNRKGNTLWQSGVGSSYCITLQEKPPFEGGLSGGHSGGTSLSVICFCWGTHSTGIM